MRLQIKKLNDDVTRMREHSREQSRQILEYRQQADMTKVSNLQRENMALIVDIVFPFTAHGRTAEINEGN